MGGKGGGNPGAEYYQQAPVQAAAPAPVASVPQVAASPSGAGQGVGADLGDLTASQSPSGAGGDTSPAVPGASADTSGATLANAVLAPPSYWNNKAASTKAKTGSGAVTQT